MPEYDVLIIGMGSAGWTAAKTLAAGGMRVAGVESELIGGVCAYWGCIPSKVLLRPGAVTWEARHAAGTTEPEIHWPGIARYRDSVLKNFDDREKVDALRDIGVDFYRGAASITGHGQIEVDQQTVGGKHLIIATGSAASIPPIPGLEDIGYWTNREATELHQAPRSVLVLGGGAVGCELGQMLHHYGARVTIVEEADQLLGQERPEAARFLQHELEFSGIDVRLGARVVRLTQTSNGKSATLDSGEVITIEVVLVATGRHAVTAGIGLERIGRQPEMKGIIVDEHCQAGDNVWAIGDVTGVAGFTHVADYQAEIAAGTILGKPRRADYSAIPRITYTDPEVASVGVTNPKQAPEGADIMTATVDLNKSERTLTYGEGYRGTLGLLAERGDRVLLGAWAAGPLASEWIQFATLAIRARVPLEVLADTMLAFPTFTRLYLQPVKTLLRDVQHSVKEGNS